MSENKNKEHLSEIDIFLYCDKELTREDRLKMDKHLEVCDKCRQLVEKTLSFSNILYETIKDDLVTERKQDCLSDMDISAYLENQVSSEERMTIEEHLSKCGYCLSIVAETKRSLEEGIKVEEPHFSYEKIMGIVKQQLREQKGKALLENFKVLVKKSPLNIRKSLEKIKNDIETIFKNTFIYPSPQFAPVFGEHEANVLSPFGKVRYPIIFEWLPYEEADQYIISIEDMDWSFNTSELRVEITAKDLKLDYGKEYMWELKIMRGEEIIDEITGFFSLASKEEIKDLMEIEEQLKSVEPEQDKFILWGGILEEKGFYMEAIEQYKKAYDLEPLDGVAYRIAYCYDRLELEELRDEWNRKILS